MIFCLSFKGLKIIDYSSFLTLSLLCDNAFNIYHKT